MAFTINLASENVALLKRARLALVASSITLVVLLGTIVMGGVLQGQRLERELVRTAELTEQHRKIEERFRQEGLVLTDEARTALKAQIQVANQIVGQRSFLWSRLFHDLERAVPWGVSLAAIQPQLSTSTLTLRGEALTESQLTGPNGLLRALEASDRFEDVSIADQKTQPNGTVGFTLHVKY